MTPEEHTREPEILWCPNCAVFVPEGSNLRARADGVLRHSVCNSPVWNEARQDKERTKITMPSHYMLHSGEEIGCQCQIGMDHDTFGRAIPVLCGRCRAAGVRTKATTKNARNWPRCGKCFAMDEADDLVLKTRVDGYARAHLEAQASKFATQAGVAKSTVRADVERALQVVETAEPWKHEPMAIRRSQLEQAMAADIESFAKPPWMIGKSSRLELARHLLDSGWVPTTKRMAR